MIAEGEVTNGGPDYDDRSVSSPLSLVCPLFSLSSCFFSALGSDVPLLVNPFILTREDLLRPVSR